MREFMAICGDTDSERALCYSLGMPEAADYGLLGFKIADKVRDYYAQYGFRTNVHCGGILMDEVAEIMRLGIELGRRIERNPIADALYIGV